MTYELTLYASDLGGGDVSCLGARRVQNGSAEGGWCKEVG